jgi:excisionase family DNA binding protein
MADKRFLTVAEVGETLNVSPGQVYSLLRSGDLPGIQIGGRGIWRIEATQLEAYIASRYELIRHKAISTDAGPSFGLDAED